MNLVCPVFLGSYVHLGISSRSGIINLSTIDVLICIRDNGGAELALALSIVVIITGFGIEDMGSNPALVAQSSRL